MERRTNQQNKSLHKYFSNISEVANDQGVTVKMMMQEIPNADIPLSPAIVKEIWRIFQIKVLDKESTADLTTKEIDVVFTPFSKFLSENFDITTPFPSIGAIMNNMRMEEK